MKHELIIDPVDHMPRLTNADPDCPKCRGFGILDDGHYAPEYVPCTECCQDAYNYPPYENIKRIKQ